MKPDMYHTCFHQPSRTRRLRLLGLLLVAVWSSGCPGSTPSPTPTPTPTGPTVTAVSPTSGPTTGGTLITVTGTNFAGGAVVTVGGAAATDVRVSGTVSLTAVTPARAAGVADVTVTVGGGSATLAGGYTYVAPVVNPLPVITALSVQGTRPNQPANFADLGEDVVVTATIVDNETPINRLLIEWTADAGTFSGSGPSVRWRAPTGIVAPAQMRLTVRVTEPLDAVVGAGPAITQSVTATTTVRVHNSVKEIADLSVQFLLDFSDSNLSPAFVVRNFWDGCPGKADELGDVENNRKNYLITAYRIDPPTSSTVAFQGTCPFRSKKGDGCVQTPVLWNAIYKPTGRSETSQGIDQTTAVYRESRWWLCDSDFNGTTTNPIAAVPFIR